MYIHNHFLSDILLCKSSSLFRLAPPTPDLHSDVSFHNKLLVLISVDAKMETNVYKSLITAPPHTLFFSLIVHIFLGYNYLPRLVVFFVFFPLSP